MAVTWVDVKPIKKCLKALTESTSNYCQKKFQGEIINHNTFMLVTPDETSLFIKQFSSRLLIIKLESYVKQFLKYFTVMV